MLSVMLSHKVSTSFGPNIFLWALKPVHGISIFSGFFHWDEDKEERYLSTLTPEGPSWMDQSLMG